MFADKKVDYFYPEHKIHNPDYIPSMIYMPRKDIMVKLMRSCLDVKEKQNLWVNKEVVVITEQSDHGVNPS